MSGTITLRPADSTDVDAIASLHAASWQRTYRGMMLDEFLDEHALANRQRVWRERLHSPPKTQLVTVAHIGDRFVGFICAFANHDATWGSYIDNLHVSPALKGRGIGTALMRAAAEWLCRVAPDRGVWLWVMEANTAARGFYDRLGARNVETVLLADPGGGQAPNCRYLWDSPASLRAQFAAHG